MQNVKELLSAYEMVGADVRPLVLIQFPAGQPETIKAVEEKLASMGYTYDNGLVNIWMSDDKIKSDDLTANNGTTCFPTYETGCNLQVGIALVQKSS